MTQHNLQFIFNLWAEEPYTGVKSDREICAIGAISKGHQLPQIINDGNTEWSEFAEICISVNSDGDGDEISGNLCYKTALHSQHLKRFRLNPENKEPLFFLVIKVSQGQYDYLFQKCIANIGMHIDISISLTADLKWDAAKEIVNIGCIANTSYYLRH